MQKFDEEPAPSAPLWLVTYGDMVTLLLTFFVMIVAMSDIKKDKVVEALQSFQSRFGGHESGPLIPILPLEDIPSTEETVRQQAEQVEALIDFIEAEGLEHQVEVNYQESTLHIVITDSVMFSSGSSRLLGTAQRVFEKIGAVTLDPSNTVAVIGHTDNVPIQTPEYPSNWELSASRAAAVVRFLLSQPGALPPEHYQAIGRGEFQPVASNITSMGRSRNRRIEILISLKPWQNQQNPTEQQILMP